MTKETENFFY